MKNYENVIFPENCRGIIDVTRPPYNLDNTGREDCTEKLRGIIDELLSEYAEVMRENYEAIKDAPEGTSLDNGRARKINGRAMVIDAGGRVFKPVIYFPNGTYLVSDTITYTLRDLHNYMFHYTSGGFEYCSNLRFMGQSREGTVIKLKDNCKGFEFGQERPVICFMNGERSNVCYSNYFENITLDVGAGNPGAVGIIHFANNTGAVRNVTVRSSDPDGEGAVGILIRNEVHSACNFYNVEIDGFDRGIDIRTFRTVAHFENITLNDQKKYGIVSGNSSVQFIGVKSRGTVPVLNCGSNSVCGQVIMQDAELTADGKTRYAAVKKEVGGCLFLKNVRTKGFVAALEENWFERTVPDGYIDEFCSMPGYTLSDEKPATIGMKIPPVPDPERENDFSKWCCVTDFGAVGDGVTDDTDAIQNAFKSGKPVVWFQPATYRITRPIEIPNTVDYVNFMFTELVVESGCAGIEGDAIFHITGEKENCLLIEKLLTWSAERGERHMFRHDSARTVFFRDMHTQNCAFYINTVEGGEVFFENCACTVGDKKVYGHMTGFHFKGKTAWCHSINPERSMQETVNDGGQIWWSGFKTEQEGSICVTKNGGVSEILGGVAVVGAGSEHPLIDNDESTVSAIFATAGYHEYSTYPIAVREKMNGETRYIRDSELPERLRPWYFMPLYSGRKKKTNNE